MARRIVQKRQNALNKRQFWRGYSVALTLELIYIIFWSVLSILIQVVLKILHYGRFWCSYSILLIHFATINVVFWSRLSILTQSHPLKRSQTIFCCSTLQQVHSLMRICSLSLGWNDAIKPRECLPFASSINEITFC